ncbi:MAG: hypothetical protein K2Y20_07135 [Sphingomonas sp.]|nr:hypothetical protein [Sphingomonas sp.]
MPRRAPYPSAAELQRVIAAARASGLDVASIAVSREGEIRLSEARAQREPWRDDFERLEAAGLI